MAAQRQALSSEQRRSVSLSPARPSDPVEQVACQNLGAEPTAIQEFAVSLVSICVVFVVTLITRMSSGWWVPLVSSHRSYCAIAYSLSRLVS